MARREGCVLLLPFIGLVVLSICSLSSGSLQGQRELSNFQRTHNNTMSDLIFLVDTSGSLWYRGLNGNGWKNGFDDEKVFVNSLLSHIRVSLPSTRISVVLFGTRATIDINYIYTISPNNHKCNFKRAFNGLKFRSGMTNMHDAFQAADDIIFGKYSGNKRPTKQVKTAVFLLTDGQWNTNGDPSPIAQKLKSNKIEVFSIGVSSGINQNTLRSLASNNRFFHYKDFSQFRELATYLRGDPYEKDWLGGQDRSKCGSCDALADCACGLVSGEYKCACPRGYYGSGYIGDCKRCPVSTYKDFEGYVKSCIPCPDNSGHTRRGSSRKADCRCKTGYEGDPGRNTPCTIKRCDIFPVPAYGRLRGGSCNNEYLTTCEVECNEGYELTASGRRTCNLDGYNAKWSGVTPRCRAITCQPLQIPNASPKTGTCNKDDMSYKTKCTFKCELGHILQGSEVRQCQLDKTWSGENTVCEEVRCPKLNSISLTQVTPADCVTKDMRFHTSCTFECPKGYVMNGTLQRSATRDCLTNGQWTGIHRACVDNEAPVITCPGDKVTNTSHRQPHAELSWNTPTFQDNSQEADPLAEVTVVSNFKSPHSFTIGRQKVRYTVTDRAKLEASCYFWVTVEDKEPPYSTSCPGDQTLVVDNANLVRVNWEAPTFKDNSGLPPSITTDRRSGSMFPLGETFVHYTVRDKSGNMNTQCEFKVHVKVKSCPKYPPPRNGALACNAWGVGNSYCQVSCNNQYDFASPPDITYLCASAKWRGYPYGLPMPWPDCSVRYNPAQAKVQFFPKFFYYSGNCNEPAAQQQIKENFVSLISTNIIAGLGASCANKAECNVGNVNVYCGETDKSKRRRRAAVREVYIKVDFVAKEKRSSPKTLNELEDILEKDSRPVIDSRAKSTDWRPLRTSTDLEYRSYSLSHAEAYCSDKGAVVGKCDSYQTGCDGKRKPQNLCSCNTDKGKIEKCIQCPEGMFFDSVKEKCIRCKPGTFQNKEGRFECHTCPEGSWTLGDEAKNFTSCREKCKPGYYSATGLARCFPCPRGTFAAGLMNTQCTTCPQGTTTVLSTATGREECGMKCAPGTFSASGVEPCKPCAKGAYQSRTGALSCNQCDGTQSTYGPGADSASMCLDINDCASNPCNNGGQCVDLKDGFRCECNAGYMGTRCEIEMDECLSDPCYQGATCIDKVNRYECVCAPGFSGQNCDVPVGLCSPNPCQNSAKCVAQPPRGVCECHKGYGGEFCEMKYDYCISSPCQNNGLCKSLTDSFQCTCMPGFTGSQCEFNRDDCAANPCMNNGACVDEINGYRCTCKTGFAGARCERNVNNCYPNHCANRGACMDKVNGFECACKPNFAGDRCQTKKISDDRRCIYLILYHSRGDARRRWFNSYNTSVSYRLFGYGRVTAVSSNFDLNFPLRVITSSSAVGNIPDMRAFTIAFWMRTTDTENPGTPLSYATTVQGKLMDNALVLQDYGAFTLYVNNEKQFIGVSANDGHWHHVAITWRNSDGKWVFYLDGKSVKSSSTGFQTNAVIRGGGVMVLGQEQDKLGDGFNAEEAFTGDISQMNVWDRVLSDNNVVNLVHSCQASEGNVRAWGDFRAGLEGVYVVTPRSHACDLNSKLRGYRFTHESRLTSHDDKQLLGKTPEQCAVECEKESAFPCRSFDYDRANNRCYLSTTVADGGNIVTSNGFDFYQTACVDAFGIESTAVPDSSLTASSSLDATSGPKESRLRKSRVFGVQGVANSRGGWSPSTNNNQQYLQVYLGKTMKVTGVATQGGDSSSEWVTSYRLQYSTNGQQWQDYSKTLTGNTDDNTVVHHQVQTFTARYVRVRPQAWRGRIALRVEIYGCISISDIPTLAVSIRSEGCEDLSKLLGGCGRAYIKVDGKEYSPQRRGFNVVVLDGSSGRRLSVLSFDTHALISESTRAFNYLRSLTGNKIVLVAIQDEGWNLARSTTLESELVRLGATRPMLKDYRGSFALAGYAGSRKPGWVRFVQRQRKLGPSVLSVKIPLTSKPASDAPANGCSPNPCTNGGRCVDLYHGYRCLCGSGYQGDRCQTASSCQDPGVPPNGRKSSSVYSHGSTVKFSCNAGYQLRGTVSRTCTRGSWSGTPATCIDIDECAAGRCAQLCTNSDGSYKCACRTGYRLNSDDRTCDDIDECSLGICSHKCFNTPGGVRCECPAGMELAPGGRTCRDKNECATGNGGCEHECTNAYLSRTCSCKGGYILEGDKINCVEIRCPSTTTPANGKQSIQGDRILGNMLTITCNAGYKLVGSATRTCQADGKWSGTQPQCEAVRCVDVGTIKKGSRQLTAGQSYSSRVSFTCTSGYALVGVTLSRTCQQDGTWGGVQPRCVRADCPALSPPAHGKIEGIRREIGSTVRASCDVGYHVTPLDAAFRTCGSNKQWTGNNPTCTLVDCGDPGTPWHGYLDGSYFKYNASVSYRCRAKHHLEGDTRRTCGADGKWTGSLPKCLERSCGNPGTPANGVKVGLNHTYGATLTFVCSKGFTLQGSSSRTCQNTGQWTGVQPTCQIKNCGDPGAPSNGFKTGNKFTYGQTVVFDCNPGYKLQGSIYRRCQEDGTWSGTQASCFVSSCGKVVHGPSGTIQSTHFPNNYPNNEYCTWEIRVPNGKRVRLDFQEFRTEDNKDIVLIYDTGKTEPIIAFSGIKNKPRALTSSGNSMRVRFISDGANVNNGFKLKYTQTDCGGMLTASTGEIRSPGFPNGYPNSISCTWLIHMPSIKIGLRLPEFNTENAYDRLEIAHGPWVTAPLEIAWSGPSPLYGDVVTQSYMWIHFFTNARNNRFYKGFRATYKPYNPYARRRK